MKQLNKVKKLLDYHIDDARVDFDNEISTEENKDYRRGFRAGVLFSFLQMRCDITTLEDEIVE